MKLAAEVTVTELFGANAVLGMLDLQKKDCYLTRPSAYACMISSLSAS